MRQQGSWLMPGRVLSSGPSHGAKTGTGSTADADVCCPTFACMATSKMLVTIARRPMLLLTVRVSVGTTGSASRDIFFGTGVPSTYTHRRAGGGRYGACIAQRCSGGSSSLRKFVLQ